MLFVFRIMVDGRAVDLIAFDNYEDARDAWRVYDSLWMECAAVVYLFGNELAYWQCEALFGLEPLSWKEVSNRRERRERSTKELEGQRPRRAPSRAAVLLRDV